jgi:protein-S-isoprenylcysteine O-methyltransferase Ste14
MKRIIIRLIGALILAVLAFAASSMNEDARVAISILVCLPSCALMIVSRRQLGESFTVAPKAKGLVTTGVYSRIQHPMYLFLDLFVLSIIIAIDIRPLIFVWAGLVLVQLMQAKREERILLKAFGAEYEAYKARTWI